MRLHVQIKIYKKKGVQPQNVRSRNIYRGGGGGGVMVIGTHRTSPPDLSLVISKKSGKNLPKRGGVGGGGGGGGLSHTQWNQHSTFAPIIIL